MLYWDYTEDITSDILRAKLIDIGISLPTGKVMPCIKFANHSKSTKTLKQSKSGASKIFQYDKEMNLVATFSTIKEAANDAKISSTSIGKAINGERFLAGGYFWYRGETPLNEFPEQWILFLTKYNLK